MTNLCEGHNAFERYLDRPTVGGVETVIAVENWQNRDRRTLASGLGVDLSPQKWR